MSDLDAQARDLLDTTAYVVLATTEPDGRPRVSPVYFTPHDHTDLYWVSRPDSRHSQNLVRDGRVSAVVYDSAAPVGAGRAVYVTGTAHEVPTAELVSVCPIAFRPALGGRAFTPEELTTGTLRLYVLHGEVFEVHVPGDDPVHGNGRDRRVGVVPARGGSR